MTLGQLKDALCRFHEGHTLRYDQPGVPTQPTILNSWRGAYEELALGHAPFANGGARTTVGQMIAACQQMNSRTLEGYKGGNYRMTYATPVSVDNWGEYRGRVSIVDLRFDGTEVLIQTREEEF